MSHQDETKKNALEVSGIIFARRITYHIHMRPRVWMTLTVKPHTKFVDRIFRVSLPIRTKKSTTLKQIVNLVLDHGVQERLCSA